MTKNEAAFLFPGQGSQRPGMGRDVYEAWEEARAAFDEVSRAAGFDVAAACLESAGDALHATAVAQPAMLAVELALTAVLTAAGVRLAAVAGHSLGEFAAWAASGALARAEAARLVVERGRLMQEAAQRHPGVMAAILGLDDAEVEHLCREAGAAGTVVPANYNCPGQVVVSGETAAVEQVMRLAEAQGAKVRALPVAGAFHSPLMAEAAERFARTLGETTFFNPGVPMVANATGDWVTDAAQARAAAVAQMTSAVRWGQGVRRLLERGVTRFYEVGPGNVLAGLVRRIEPSVEVLPAGDAASVRQIIG